MAASTPSAGSGSRSVETPRPRRSTDSARLASKLAEWESRLKPSPWSTLAPSLVTSAHNATMTVLADRSVLASGDKPNNDVYRVEVPVPAPGVTAIRLEVLPDDSLPDRGPGRAHLFSVGNFLLTEVEVAEVSPDGKTSRPIPVRDASADFNEAGRPPSQVLDGKVDTGWSIGGAVGQPHAIVLRLAEPLRLEPGRLLRLTLHQFTIHQTTIGRFRVSTTTMADPPPASGLPAEVEELALISPDRRTPDQAAILRRHFLSITPELAGAVAEIAALRRTRPALSTSMVLQERPGGQARTTRVHRRGRVPPGRRGRPARHARGPPTLARRGRTRPAQARPVAGLRGETRWSAGSS